MRKDFFVIRIPKLKIYPYSTVVFLLFLVGVCFSDIQILRLAIQAVAICFSVLNYRKISEKMRPILNKYIIWAFLFLAYNFASILWSSEKNTTGVTVSLAILQVILIVCNVLIYCNSEQRANLLIKFYITSCIFLAIRVYLSIPISMWGDETRISAYADFVGNGTGIALATGTILLFAYNVQGQKIMMPPLKIIFLFIFMIAPAFATGTKKVIIVLIVGISVLILSRTKNPVSILWRLIVVFGVIIGIYFAVLYVDILYSMIGYRLEDLVNGLLGSGDTDGSSRTRIAYFTDALEVFLQNPIFGVGCDGYRYLSSSSNYSHTNYTELLSTLGIAGFMLYYSFFATFLKKSLKTRKYTQIPLILISIRIALDFAMVSFSSESTWLVVSIVICSTLYRHCSSENIQMNIHGGN